MKKQVLGIPKLPVSETDRRATEGQENRDFLRGASLCRCITFPDNLPHLEVRGTAPDGHKINNKN